jgi:N-hydroxyarylamine O-acetyltransferase
MAAEGGDALDIPAYLRRIGYAGDLSPTRSTLDALHLAHTTSIPFENLDILLGVPIRLDLPSLQAKLVANRRGGYCFEQNTLFASVLERLGVTVTRLAARVRCRTDRVLPRTHMTLRVDLDGAPLLADVGFGADGLLLPVPLDGGPSQQFAWSYRVIGEGGVDLLQSRRDGRWEDLYAFTHEPQLPVDYEIANHYTSTHPASRFTQMLTAQMCARDVRRTLRDLEYTEDRGAATRERSTIRASRGSRPEVRSRTSRRDEFQSRTQCGLTQGARQWRRPSAIMRGPKRAVRVRCSSDPRMTSVAIPFRSMYPAFAAGYLLSYFYRNVNAVISPELTRELSPGSLGLLTAVYFVAFATPDSRGHAARSLRAATRGTRAAASVAAMGSLISRLPKVRRLLVARALIGSAWRSA